MSEDDVTKILSNIFNEIFIDSEFSFNRNLSANDIDEWDSLTHINLIVAIEKEFDISFTLDELDQLNNVGDTIDMILKK